MQALKYFVLLLSLGLLLNACVVDSPQSKGGKVEAPANSDPKLEEEVKKSETPPPPPPEIKELQNAPVVTKPGSSTGNGNEKEEESEQGQGAEKGELLYAIPDSMKVNKVERVEIRIARGMADDNLERLTNQLKNADHKVVNVIETGEVMKVEIVQEDISNPKFSIDPLTPIEQSIPKGGIGYWAWNVKPLTSGEHLLSITAALKKKSETTGELVYQASSRVLDRNIAVVAVEDNTTVKEEGPNWLAIGGGASLLLALLVAIGIWRSKSQQLISVPLIDRAELDKIEDLIKEGKLENALDGMEGLVKVVRDKEHNLIISYKAELKTYNDRYNSGEISYEELSKVKARIRRAIVEMNDRLGGEASD